MQIIQQTTRTTAQETVQGVTITYFYENEKDTTPTAVAFSATRTSDSNQYATPIQGTATAQGFNIQNDNFQASDIELYKHIHDTCTAIINGQSTNDKNQVEQ